MRIALFTGNYNYVREGANQALNRLVAHLEQHAGAAVRVYSPVTDTPAFEPAGDLVSLTDCRAQPAGHLQCVPPFITFMLGQLAPVAQGL